MAADLLASKVEDNTIVLNDVPPDFLVDVITNDASLFAQII